MGTIQHHAIVVTPITEDEAESIRTEIVDFLKSTELTSGDINLERLVSPMVQSLRNGYCSFLIAADGSKEYWPCSDEMNKVREVICTMLDEKDVSYIHVSYGELGSRIEGDKE